MPVLMPTQDELANMSQTKRLKIRRSIARILTSLDDVMDTEARRVAALMEWGESVRAEARRLEATEPRDSDAVIHARRMEWQAR